VRVPEITNVPDAAEFVEGVINLRGKIVPVVDLRKRFGERTITSHKKNRILVAEVEGKRIGLMVDAASEVLRLQESELELPHNVFESGELSYVTGVGKIQDRLVIVIDLNKILQKGELRRLAQNEPQTAEPTA
jgi:purine-binding chemotaxis protein CheW